MSYFGTNEKDNLYDEMEMFLENHSPSELLEIVGKAIDDKMEESN